MNFNAISTSEDVLNLETNQPSITLKKCSRCKAFYNSCNFKLHPKKLTYSKQCVTCQEKQLKFVMNHYNKNKDNQEYRDKVKGYRDKYTKSDTYKQYRESRNQDKEVTEKKKQYNREWRANNLERAKERERIYYATYYTKHKDTEEYRTRKKEQRLKPEIKKQRNKRQKERRENEISVRIRDNVSRRINKALRNINSVKSDKTIEYLNCSIDFFVKHIENQFNEGMSWDNYGRSSGDVYWEIDHIIPINYENPTVENVIERMHYTNCQPMWAEENRTKSNKFIG